MSFAHHLVTQGIEIGKCAGNAAHTVIPAAGESISFEFGTQQALRAGFEGCERVEERCRNGSVETAVSMVCEVPGARHTRRDDRRWLSAVAQQQLVDLRPVHGNSEIETIEQRPRQPTQITGTCAIVAFARTRGAAAARTRIRCSNEQELRGKRCAGPRSRHTDNALFQRLTQSVEHRGGELALLVEKKYSTVDQCTLMYL